MRQTPMCGLCEQLAAWWYGQLNINATATPRSDSSPLPFSSCNRWRKRSERRPTAQLWPRRLQLRRVCLRLRQGDGSSSQSNGYCAAGGSQTPVHWRAKWRTSSPSASAASVALSGTALNAGSTTPVNVGDSMSSIRHPAPARGRLSSTRERHLVARQQVTNLASPSSLSNIQATINCQPPANQRSRCVSAKDVYKRYGEQRWLGRAVGHLY